MPSQRILPSLLCFALSALAASVITATALKPTADEPDGLRLPPGFHATVVAEGIGAIRHLAVSAKGNIYISTPRDQQGNGNGAGIIALHLDSSHKADQTQHFGSVDGGTGIRFYDG